MGSVLALYAWTLSPDGDPAYWQERAHGPRLNFSDPKTSDRYLVYYHQFLADAFLAGHLNIGIPPSPLLLALPDPFDWVPNTPVRLSDLSLYKNRYYMYFGPTPALVLFAPFKAIFRRDLDSAVALFLLASGGFLLSTSLFLSLVSSMERSQGRAAPGWLRVCAILSLGLTQFVPVLLRTPRVYQVAIASAYFFLMAAFLFLFQSLRENRVHIGKAFLASLCLGLCCGSRPNFIPISGIIVVLFAAYLWISSGSWKALYSRGMLALVTPLAAIGLLMAWYNYARFDTPLEFGSKYQVTGIPNRGVPFRFDHIVPGLYFYLVALPRLTHPPFLQPNTGFYPFGKVSSQFSTEPMIGILVTTPLAGLAFGLPLLFASLYRRKPEIPLRTAFLMTALFSSFMGILLIMSLIGWITFRYYVDLVPSMLLVAFAGTGWLCLHWESRVGRLKWIKWATIFLTVYGIAWNVPIAYRDFFWLHPQLRPVLDALPDKLRYHGEDQKTLDRS